MNISVINTGYFKLDGGAMFGIVPKRMWEKLNPPDENNLCTWSLRCLLIEMENHKILIDTGIGDKQDEKFRSHFEPHGENNLKKNLEKKGINVEDITDVFLTHLHFDHCGGAVSRNLPTGQAGTEGALFPTFPNATYWTNQTHYNWAMNPNGREAASFLKENFEPLMQQGVLKFVEEKDGIELFKNIKIHYTFGHTESMMMLEIKQNNKILVFCSDTMPTQWHIGMPYIMAYDIRPMESLKEKEWLLNKAVTEGWYLFFEHDPMIECATVKKDERNCIVLDRIFKIESLFD
jgi:glyoxylase-like metal-dependent hydrolase (beta-lactamase superfamily II)